MTRARWVAGVLCALAVFAVCSLLVYRHAHDPLRIAEGVRSFDELRERFREIARDRGALFAYDVLRHAPLPEGTDVHLLGHVVGDELYVQQGVRGIEYCTQEFRNACSHTIVIGALTEFGGDEALSLIRDACERAPGGTGAYTMCYHGLGHGVFAYHGYDLEKTIAFCKKTATTEHHEREYAECVGGAIMELMGGGGHDRVVWLASRARYLDPRDPLAPCSTSIVPHDVKGVCYTYITPNLFEMAGADLARPAPKDFAQAFLYCDALPEPDTHLRRDCFGGIGKEFPVLALSRDVRALDAVSDAALMTMRQWCALAPHDEAYEACSRSIVSSLFWGGESDARTVVRFCDLAAGVDRERCFAGVFEEAGRYPSMQYPGAQLCTILPDDQTDACAKIFI